MAVLICGVWLIACQADAPTTGAAADIIFIGDNIITMDDMSPEAIAVTGDRISAIGGENTVLAHKGVDTRVIDLGNQALLPGFIDAHGHIALVARLIDLSNLSSPPVGQVNTIADLKATLSAHIRDNNIEPGAWVIGYGYDESLLAEQRHPTRDDLDGVSTDHPIVIIHASFHLSSANSLGLTAAGYDAKSQDPEGGRIRRRAGSTEPNGVLEETAAQPLLFNLLQNDNDDLGGKIRRALETYAAYGITTAQDGAAGAPDIATIRAEAATSDLPIDLVAFPHLAMIGEEGRAALKAETYEGGFRIGGGKLTLDGSIQGKTGYLGQPYTEPPDGQDADYKGYPMIPAELYQSWVTPVIKRGVPMLIHANGDGAIDMMLDGLEVALDGATDSDHRTVIIHAQMMREDQIVRAGELGAVPSFFSNHPFFWGDWHRQILGEERAARISPLQSALTQGVPFTVHNDAPVVPADMMFLLDTTVNRRTRSGHVLGPEQRPTVMQALHAMTLGAAYQYFEEGEKGSISVGKRADLVILSANPLSIDPLTLKDIEVVETFSRGQSVFSNKALTTK